MAGIYSIRKQKRAGVDVYVLAQGPDVTAEIAPQWGNNCYLFQWKGYPVLEKVDFETIAQKPTSYGIPILYPYPNRIRDGRFSFRGRQYQLDPPRHGFVRDKPWQVDESGASGAEGAWLRCSFDAANYPDQILSQFPFRFQCEVTYRLQDDRLVMETVGRNTGPKPMPVGLGTHAYFTRPVDGTIQVPAERIYKLEDSLPTGELMDVAGTPYDLLEPTELAPLELDDIYADVLTDSEGVVRCQLRDNRRRVQTTVEFLAEEFPIVVVYTAPAPRRAICIEPYTCPTDAFNLANQPGVPAHVIELPPGKEISWTMTIATQKF